MQPKFIRIITLWSILANMLILTGSANGTFLIVAEIVSPFYPDRIVFSLNNFYDELLPVAAVLSLAGQLIVACGLLFRGGPKIIFTMTGLLFSYIGLFYLSSNLIRDSDAQLSLASSTPFLVLSLILIYKMVTGYIRQVAIPDAVLETESVGIL